MAQTLIPPPPPYPPGDPRLGPAHASYPAPSWMAPASIAQPPVAYPAYGQPARSGKRLGRVPTVAAIVGVGALIVAGLVATFELSNPDRNDDQSAPALPRVASTLPAAAPPPLVVTPSGTGAPLAAAPTKGIDLGTSPALSVALPKIEAFVEEARGHRFLRPVTVTTLADKAFLAKLNQGGDGGPAGAAEIAGTDATFEALHLLPPHTDLAATLATQKDAGVAGFYDPKTKSLYVRSATLTPLAQTILAHELTHALDDQYFDLQHVQDQATNNDQDLAIRSLIEGDARSVEDRFKAAMVPAERTRVAAETKREFGSTAGAQPPVFLEIYSAFPYEMGEQFVNFLRAHGGAAAVDAAFKDPPISSLQVIDPRYTYLQRLDPVGPSQPLHQAGTDATGHPTTTVDEDSLGALGLAAILSEKNPRDLLLEQSVAYWDGDNYVTTRDGTQTCVRDVIHSFGGSAQAAMLSPLAAWARTHPGASAKAVPGSSTDLILTSCIG